MDSFSSDIDHPGSLLPCRQPWSPSPSASPHPCYSPAVGPSFSSPPRLHLSTPYHIPFPAPSSDAAPRNHSCYPPAVGPSFNCSPRLRHSTPYARPAIGSSNVHHRFNPTPSKEVDYNRRALPHQILASAFCAPEAHNKEDVWMAEQRWERMVSDLRSTGKFRNSIVVYHRSTNMSKTAKQVSIAMALLISELSQPPWQWTAFDLEEDPYLFYIGGNSILDKARFLTNYLEGSQSQYYLDYEMVFKQILMVAEDAKLKQDEMIKRVFLFTDGSFESSSYYRQDSWKHEYKMLHSMFSMAGHVMPKIVFCDFNQCFTDKPRVSSDTENVQRMPDGVTQMVDGMSDDLLKLFLEKDAVLTQKDIIEARGDRIDPLDEEQTQSTTLLK